MDKIKELLRGFLNSLLMLARKTNLGKFVYLLLTSILISLAYWNLSSLRQNFYKLAILTAQQKILRASGGGSRQEHEKVNLIDRKISAELDTLMTSTDKASTIKWVFFLLTFGFALINGPFFSEGFRKLMVFFRWRAIVREMGKIQNEYEDYKEIKLLKEQSKQNGGNKYEEITGNFLVDNLKKKYTKIYLHGYWRGFAESHKSLPDVCMRFFYKKALRELDPDA
ncbi:MAG: hypothetical protein ONB44_07685 [candidate division KSB1 bacterium]|nr:hypothetical protein [candidate division KSB1 bacterium]MDZ7302008.1 hypothetical protein [candidate division KSB1 bacterium]MDZ7310190.1 hypothetical protein [candidate division KSB1 bacterium]